MPVHLNSVAQGLGVSAITLALFFLQSACSDAPEEDPEPSVELGTGTLSFEALDEGQDIFIIQGSQGGYHFSGSMRALGLRAGDAGNLTDPSNPTTTFEIFSGQERLDAMASSYTQGIAMQDGVAQMLGRKVILDIEEDDDIAGLMVRFTVEVRDVDGVVVFDTRNLRAVPHPNNQ